MKKAYFILDEKSKIIEEKDTSLLLMKELKKRGFSVKVSLKNMLFLNEKNQLNLATYESFYQKKGDNFYEEENQILEIPAENDLIFMRLDPPVDTEFYQICQLLLNTKAKVVNSPLALMKYSEKQIPFLFPGNKDSIISSSFEQILQWISQNSLQKIVLKSLNEYAGREVISLEINDDKFEENLLNFVKKNKVICVQKFLEKVWEGDRRIFLTQKSVIGKMNRIPSKNDFRANTILGSTTEDFTLNNDDLEMVKNIQKFMRENDIFIACTDSIDGFLTEVNITSPSGLPPINKISQENNEVKLIDDLLADLG